MPPSSADATLLPPPLGLDSRDDDDSSPPTRRSLDHVGAVAVLGALMEQRRASQPAADELVDPYSADEPPTDPELEQDADATLETRPPPRVPAHSDAFLKAR